MCVLLNDLELWEGPDPVECWKVMGWAIGWCSFIPLYGVGTPMGPGETRVAERGCTLSDIYGRRLMREDGRKMVLCGFHGYAAKESAVVEMGRIGAEITRPVEIVKVQLEGIRFSYNSWCGPTVIGQRMTILNKE